MRSVGLYIHPRLRRLWRINEQNILESRSLSDGCPVFKFCYCPETGEFIFGLGDSYHKEIIEEYGNKSYGRYIRGIYFKDKKIIYLRLHENREWLKLTETFLRKRGVSNKIRIIWGKIAAIELAYELRGL